MRKIWPHYYQEAQCVIFMVDGSDRDRVQESYQVLQELIKHPDLVDLPFILVVSKHDKENCMSQGFLQELLDTQSITNRQFTMLYSSAFTL